MTYDLFREADKARLILLAAKVAEAMDLPASKHVHLMRALNHLRSAETELDKLGMDMSLIDEFSAFFKPEIDRKPAEEPVFQPVEKPVTNRLRKAVESDENDEDEFFESVFRVADKP